MKSRFFYQLKNIVEISPRTVYGVVFDSFGPPSKVLKLKEFPFPSIMYDNQVHVKMVAAPVNPSDINMIEGTYGNLPELPSIAGNEGIGVVLKTGRNVKNLKIGDRVVVTTKGKGTWVTENIFEENDLILVPDGISDEAAACITINPVSAYRMLKDFVDVTTGENNVIIQNGSTSNVGRSVIQLCKYFGVDSINVIRQRPDFESIKEELIDYGATYVVTDKDLRDKKFEFKLPKPKLGLNCVGGASAELVCKELDKNGVLVTYGGMSKRPITMGTAPFIFEKLTLTGFWLDDCDEELKKKSFDTVMKIINECDWKVATEVHGLEEIDDVISNYFKRKYTKGKTLIKF